MTAMDLQLSRLKVAGQLSLCDVDEVTQPVTAADEHR
jgi:hypothetical protein